MTSSTPSALISADQLSQRLRSGESLKILDGTFYLPTEGKDARALFEASHIEGAQFFDIDAISTPSPLPHTAPTPEIFAQAVGDLGISADDWVVVYDQKNLFSAPRVWLTFRMFGHENVLVLNGGLPAWVAAGLPTSDQPSSPSPTQYVVKQDLRGDYLADSADVQAALDKGQSVADARPAGRFSGADKEPRAGMRSGHMPGALSLPLASLIDDKGQMLSDGKLKDVFARIDTEGPIITTCGSGVTASGLSLGLHELGVFSRVYDGSWSEWGQESSGFPVVEGED